MNLFTSIFIEIYSLCERACRLGYHNFLINKKIFNDKIINK